MVDSLVSEPIKSPGLWPNSSYIFRGKSAADRKNAIAIKTKMQTYHNMPNIHERAAARTPKGDKSGRGP